MEDKDCTPEQRSVREVNTGTYLFHAPALLAPWAACGMTTPRGLYLTDVPALIKADGGRVGLCDTCSPDEMLGVNTPSPPRKSILLECALTPIQQYGYTTGKNSTDSAMIIDAMDILYSGNCDGFVLVSSDSDFTRLAIRLREAGMKVYGMGGAQDSQALYRGL